MDKNIQYVIGGGGGGFLCMLLSINSCISAETIKKYIYIFLFGLGSEVTCLNIDYGAYAITKDVKLNIL